MSPSPEETPSGNLSDDEEGVEWVYMEGELTRWDRSDRAVIRVILSALGLVAGYLGGYVWVSWRQALDEPSDSAPSVEPWATVAGVVLGLLLAVGLWYVTDWSERMRLKRKR